MTAATITLTDFLLARIADDETVARKGPAVRLEREAWRLHLVFDLDVADPLDIGINSARVLAECAAKRAIVERQAAYAATNFREVAGCPDLRALASVYANHDDFDPRWAL